MASPTDKILINIQNNLPNEKNTQIKFYLKYSCTIDDIDTLQDYVTMKNGKTAIAALLKKDCKSYKRIHVYLLYKDTAYKYFFLFIQNEGFNVTIDMGTTKPIIRINNNKAYDVDIISRYGCYRICCCGNIDWALDDIEQARIDAISGCVIL